MMTGIAWGKPVPDVVISDVHRQPFHLSDDRVRKHVVPSHSYPAT